MPTTAPVSANARWLTLAAGLLGATAVALGAFAAHGLSDALAGFGYKGDELSKRLENFVTGSRYQLTTAAAVLAIGLAAGRRPLLHLAGWILVGGVLVFSGLLYVLAFAGPNWKFLGAIVPLGGLAMIGGWILASFSILRSPNTPPEATVTGATPSGDSACSQPSLAEEVVRLEEVITHQQQLVQDLNEALTALRDEADDVARRQNTIDQTVRRLVDLQQAAEDLPDEKPPHY